VDVHLPPRHALTIRLDAEPEEAVAYETLSRLVAQAAASATSQERFALRRLLSAAGSTPAAAAAAIERYVGSRNPGPGSGPGDEWRELLDMYSAIGTGTKEKALVELLRRNEAEKKIVFVHHRETLAQLSELFDREGLRHETFEGSMSAAAKDAAIARFRDETPLLLSTESGGEGRNLQFSNTLVNFDLPWNPMAIEQRIGRIHRIGQTRDVYIFNLVARGTLEERMLQVLDEKINMFELVVGEIDAILGEMDEHNDFAELAFSAWVATTEAGRGAAFDALGERLCAARRQYENVKVLDEELFGEEFVAG
jgi:SNF2 family DNA or RNA helicase